MEPIELAISLLGISAGLAASACTPAPSHLRWANDCRPEAIVDHEQAHNPASAAKIVWPCQPFSLTEDSVRLVGGEIGGSNPYSLSVFKTSSAGLISVSRGGKLVRFSRWDQKLWSREAPDSKLVLAPAGRDGVLAWTTDEVHTEVSWISAVGVTGPWFLNGYGYDVVVGEPGAVFLGDAQTGSYLVTERGVVNVELEASLVTGFKEGWAALIEDDQGDSVLRYFSPTFAYLREFPVAREWSTAIELAGVHPGESFLAAIDRDGRWGLWSFSTSGGQRRMLTGPDAMYPSMETPVLAVSEQAVAAAFPVRDSPFLCDFSLVRLPGTSPGQPRTP